MNFTMESTLEVDNAEFKDILNMLICCIHVRKSTDCCCFLLQWRSLFAFSTLVIFGEHFISSIQKPIYIDTIFTLGFSLNRSLFILIGSSFASSRSLFFFFCLSFLFWISLSSHAISTGCKGRADGFFFLRPCCGFAAAAGLR